MKYFLAQSIMYDPLPIPPKDLPGLYIPMHEKHIASGIEAGMVLFAGPKLNEGGGFMVARAESREELDAFTARDPFVVNGIAYFEVKEFLMNDRSEYVKNF